MATLPGPARYTGGAPFPWARVGVAVAGLAAIGSAFWVVGEMFVRRNGGRIPPVPTVLSTLRNVASCQEQWADACAVDEDGDGVGEFGGLAEMASGAPARGRPEEALDLSGVAAPVDAVATSRAPVLSGAFRAVAVDGTVARFGYRYRMVLLGRDGTFPRERPRVGFGDGVVDPDAAETRWLCYAWPDTDDAGDRTFVVDETGTIAWTRDRGYVGALGPAPDAAVDASSDERLGPTADGVAGRDGNVWRAVGR